MKSVANMDPVGNVGLVDIVDHVANVDPVDNTDLVANGDTG
jgi:hypothetical protein